MRLFLPRLGFAMFALASVAIGADAAKPSPTPEPRKATVTLAELLSMHDDELSAIDPAAMYLLAYQGFSYGKIPIDFGKGEAEIDSLAQFYRIGGFAASNGGDEIDRQRFLALYQAFQSQPPEHCPIPISAFMVSIGRRMGYPVSYANTAKGIQVCMRDPTGQDCFVDLHAKEPQWWRIQEEIPQPQTGVEQIGKIPGEKPPMLHWIFQPKDILGLALVERAQRLKVGNLSAYVAGKDGGEDVLCIENEDGKFSMKPKQWEHATLLSLIAFLQAQSVSDRADLRRWISVASKVSGKGWRGLIDFTDELAAPFDGPVDPKIHPVDKKTPPIKNLALEKLLEKEPDQLNGIDVGLMNLACANELPGSEKIDIPAALAELDQWAEIVAARIKNNHALFDKNPAKFDNSENKFMAAMLVLCLQSDIGVHYNAKVAAVIDPDVLAKKYPGERIDGRLSLMELARQSAGADSQDQFITGILGKNRSGTCASMPVIYTAVGRRLGFPLKLVTVPGHLFVRWESPKETFNIEGTNGFSIHSDDYYRKWPIAIWPHDEQEHEYLKSLTPADEFAMFLRDRARCLEDKGRIVEAMLSQAQSCRYRNLLVDRHRLIYQDALINNESYYGK